MVNRLIARKYERAFLNHFDYKDCTREFIFTLDSVVKFMKKNKIKFSGLRMNSYFNFFSELEIKKDSFILLLKLLERDKRLKHLPEVLESIRDLCLDYMKVLFCTIFSSHDLDSDEKEIMSKFIERKTGKTVFYRHVIDKSLIAGIRVVGDNFVWEDSVAKGLGYSHGSS